MGVAVIFLLGLGLVSASVLAVASKVLAVDEDPRVEMVTEALPGANCGGCGFASCEAYAIAMVTDPSVPTTKCVVGPDTLPNTLAELTGKASGAVVKKIAVRHCTKKEGNVQRRYQYTGYTSCASAATFGNGFDACSYSCLGLGDCVRECPFDSMAIVNELVVIYSETCTGCGKCIEVCPRDVLTLAPIAKRVEIICSTQDKPKDVMAVCGVGCISCSKCIKACPADAIAFDHKHRIRIDHEKCIAYGESCGEACVIACPRKILRSKSDDFLAKSEELKEAS